jgi:hypothetical protein
MFRAVLIVIAALLFIGSCIGVATVGPPAIGPAIFLGLVLAGLLFENHRYRQLSGRRPAATSNRRASGSSIPRAASWSWSTATPPPAPAATSPWRTRRIPHKGTVRGTFTKVSMRKIMRWAAPVRLPAPMRHRHSSVFGVQLPGLLGPSPYREAMRD